VGTLVGPVLSGYLRTVVGWGNAMLTLGVVSAATAVVTVFFTGGKITKTHLGMRRRTDVEEQRQEHV